MKTTTQSDRIDRALEIIKGGHVLKVQYHERDANWFVASQSKQDFNYKVESDSCTCPDASSTGRPARICKHMWAGPGAPAALLISKIRACTGFLQLREIAEMYAPALADVPALFIRVARSEYKLACRRICTRITFDTAPEPASQQSERGLAA